MAAADLMQFMLSLEGLDTSLPSPGEQARKKEKAMGHLRAYVEACGGKLPDGWDCGMSFRLTSRSYGRMGRTTDNYYYSPCGSTFRTHKQVAEFLGLSAPQRQPEEQQFICKVLPMQAHAAPTTSSSTSSRDCSGCSGSSSAKRAFEDASIDAADSGQPSKRPALTATPAAPAALATPVAAAMPEADACPAAEAAPAPCSMSGPSSCSMQHTQQQQQSGAVCSGQEQAAVSMPPPPPQPIRRTKMMLAAKYASSAAAASASTSSISCGAVAPQSGGAQMAQSQPAAAIQPEQQQPVVDVQHTPAVSADSSDCGTGALSAAVDYSNSARSNNTCAGASSALTAAAAVAVASQAKQQPQQKQRHTTQKQRQQQQEKQLKPRQQPEWRTKLRLLATQLAASRGAFGISSSSGAASSTAIGSTTTGAAV